MCQESVGILERTDIVDFCLDWEVKWSWIYRPCAVSALTMAGLRGCMLSLDLNQWRRDATPVYM